MDLELSIEQLTNLGLTADSAQNLLSQLRQLPFDTENKAQLWRTVSTTILKSNYPFTVHLLIFNKLFLETPVWSPLPEEISTSNIHKIMHAKNLQNLSVFHAWSTDQYEEFWKTMTTTLNIVFDESPKAICDSTEGVESITWFPGSKLNITNSCFNAPADSIAIIFADQDNNLQQLTYAELNQLSNRIANSLVKLGLQVGDAIGIAMPMNHLAVAAYLAIIKMGGVVVSIADSFSAAEIATRLDITHAKALFTQDFSLWAGKKLPLYEKVRSININTKIILLPYDPLQPKHTSLLNDQDIFWDDFLVSETTFSAVSCAPMTPANILFSSGTTGTPKAIIWNHTTPIKCASDAFFHQNIQAGDRLAWPTNLGWMMGPWLIYAALINKATLVLYTGAPKDEDFGNFIARTKVTMLGVVPTLVAAWRQSKCMEGIDWSNIKTFSSTGECSNPEDMFYLMYLAGYKPVIEYCGGTEIGGAYLSSTVIQDNYPALFSTPVMGINIAILNDQGNFADQGEVAIIPPSVGLSTQLMNANHHDVYFADMPNYFDGRILRRHGDHIKRYTNGYFSILGRVDDTMKLGGIKTSAAEIERTLAGFPEIIEVAAIAIQPADNGPSQLVIIAATLATLEKQAVLQSMQKRLNQHLNPLFKIYDLIFVKELPKTASNKIMRRILRQRYQHADR